jgi:hypothetical protein
LCGRSNGGRCQHQAPKVGTDSQKAAMSRTSFIAMLEFGLSVLPPGAGTAARQDAPSKEARPTI